MQQEIVLSPKCRRMREELLGYRWKPDGQGGSLPRPEGEDHLIDALRYALEGDSAARDARVMKRFV
jgi:phage terminase large subunit